MANIGNILEFSFFGILQIYLYLSVGAYAYLRKKMTNDSLKMISGLIFNFFIPIFYLLETSRVSSITKLSSYWILAILTFLCLTIRLIVMKFIAYIFNIDKKIEDGFVLVNSFPGLGTMSLIIGKGLCYPSCPLDGDPLCSDIIGLMMIINIANYLMMFIVGILIILNSKNKYDLIKEKLRFIYYRQITETKREDIFAKYLIHKFIEDEDEVDQIYEEFVSSNNLECTSSFKYVYSNSSAIDLIDNNNINIIKHNNEEVSKDIHIDNKYIDDPLKDLKDLVIPSKNNNNAEINEMRQRYKNNFNSNNNNINLNNNINEMIVPTEQNINDLNAIVNLEEKPMLRNNKKSSNEKNKGNVVILSTNRDNLRRSINIEQLHHNIEISEKIINHNLRKSKINKKPHINIPLSVNDCNASFSHKIDPDKLVRLNSLSSNYTNNNFFRPSIRQTITQQLLKKRLRSKSITVALQHQAELNDKLNSMDGETLGLVDLKGLILYSKEDKESINKYYDALFDCIENKLLADLHTHYNTNVNKRLIHYNLNNLESNINMNTNSIENQIIEPYIYQSNNIIKSRERILSAISMISTTTLIDNKLNNRIKLYNEFQKEALEVKDNINSSLVPKFIPIDSMNFTNHDKLVLEKIWVEFIKETQKYNIEIKLNITEVKLSLKFILDQLVNPPVISCILGVFIGVSGLRDVLFSDNHHITNLYNVFNIASKPLIPLMCVNAGFAIINAPKLNLNFSITRTQLIISYVTWLIVFPIIGYCIILLFTEIYGGLIETSKVFRYCIFISYALPCSTNLVILFSIVNNYYLKEYSYILNRETISMFITQTLLLLVFFVIEDD